MKHVLIILYRVMPVFFCIFSSNSLFAENVNISLFQNASITSGQVFLKDIASITSDNVVTAKIIKNIFITKSPRIGYIEKISEKDVRRVIMKKPVLRNVKINFTGFNNVNIHSKGKKYPYKKLTEIARVKLLNELISDNREVVVNFNIKTEYINLPYGDLKFESRLNSKSISSKMCVWIDVFRQGEFYRSVPVWANIEVYESVYIAEHHISKNSIVIKSDFILARKNIAPLNSNHLKNTNFHDELLLKKTISAGSILRKDNVKYVPAIISGTVLDARVKQGAVSIEVKAISRKDAEIGEIINVKSLQGGNTLKTKVIGKQLVEII